jgi:hypothetical protein
MGKAGFKMQNLKCKIQNAEPAWVGLSFGDFVYIDL